MKLFIIPIYLIAGVSLISTAYAARILGIFMMPGRSRFVYNHAILKSLHAAGHHITMITRSHSEHKVENFTYINPPTDDAVDIPNRNSLGFDAMTITLSHLIKSQTTVMAKQCHDVMKLTEIKEALTSSEKVYDVMFIETMIMQECYQILAAKLHIPIIGTVSLYRWQLADDSLGIPIDLTVPIPFGLKATGRELNFFQRVQNVWSYIVKIYHCKMGTRATEIKRFRQEYFSEEPSASHANDMSLVFYNGHPAFAARLITPNAIEIGGIHLQPANALPKDLQTFIDGASHGVILFSFGSVLNASKIMTFQQRQAFITAFASIPQRVIWKFEGPIADLPQNIMLSKWLPQRDILEHKNVMAFISHCGTGGAYEAIVTSTPVIAVPQFGDQPANALQLVRLGVAVNLELETVTKNVILDALNAVINDTSYYKRMQSLSRAFKDRPMTPQESVVYWTEYVIRNNGAPHLRVLGADMPLYKYFMLDILALALLITSAVFLVIRALTRKIYGLILRTTIIRGVSKIKFQ